MKAKKGSTVYVVVGIFNGCFEEASAHTSKRKAAKKESELRRKYKMPPKESERGSDNAVILEEITVE